MHADFMGAYLPPERVIGSALQGINNHTDAFGGDWLPSLLAAHFKNA
jgi:hypothetical protein